MTELVCTLLQLYWLIILIRVVMSWVPTREGTAADRAKQLAAAATEPVMAPVRQLLPPVRLGAAALDLSPIVVLLGLQLLIGWICT